MATDKIPELFDQKAYDQLLKINEELYKTVQSMDKLAQEAGKLSTTMGQTQTTLKNTADATKELNKNQLENEKLTKQIEALELKLTKAKESTVKATTKLSQSEKDIQKFRQAQVGSINQMAAANTILEKRLKSVNLETEKGAQTAARLRSAIDKNNAKIKENSSALSAQKIGIGDYPKTIALASMSLGDLRKEMMLLKKTSFVGKSPEEVSELKQRLGDLMDTMGDVRAEMQVLGGPGIGAVVGGLKFIAAGVEGVIGTLSVFGVESDVIQNLEKKMTALIAVTQALSEIEDMVNSGKLRAIGLKLKDMAVTTYETAVKWASVTATVAQTKAEEAKIVMTGKAGIATKAAAAMQWLWNTAVAANPIGAIVVALGLMVGAIYLLVTAEKKQTTAMQDVIKAHKDEFDEMVKAETKLQDLTVVMTDATKTEKQRKEAKEAYNKIAKENNLLLINEIGSQKEMNDLIKVNSYLIEARMMMKIAEMDVEQAIIDKRTAMESDEYKQVSKAAQSGNVIAKQIQDEYFKQFEARINSRKKEVSGYNNMINLIMSYANKGAEGEKRLLKYKLDNNLITLQEYNDRVAEINANVLKKTTGTAKAGEDTIIKLMADVTSATQKNLQKRIDTIDKGEKTVTNILELNHLIRKGIQDVALAKEKGGYEAMFQSIGDSFNQSIDAMDMGVLLENLAKIPEIVDGVASNYISLAMSTRNTIEGFQESITEFLKNSIDAEKEMKEAAFEEDKARFAERAQFAITSLDSVKTVSDAIYGREIELIDRKMSKLDQESVQYKQLAREKAELEYKQAVMNKALRLAMAIINTAAGVAAQLMIPGAGIGLAIAAGVVGAASIAAIALEPLPEIPSFYKGTESAPGGVSRVAERGSELLIEPDGNIMLANKEMLINLKKGTKVLTNQKTERILQDINYTSKVSNSNAKLEYLMGEQLLILKKNSGIKQNNNIFVTVNSPSRFKHYD